MKLKIDSQAQKGGLISTDTLMRQYRWQSGKYSPSQSHKKKYDHKSM